MAIYRKNMEWSEEDKKQLRNKREWNITPRNSFYLGIIGRRPNEKFESAGNRRAADVYVQNN